MNRWAIFFRPEGFRSHEEGKNKGGKTEKHRGRSSFHRKNKSIKELRPFALPPQSRLIARNNQVARFSWVYSWVYFWSSSRKTHTMHCKKRLP
jgi:hypothetical protein